MSELTSIRGLKVAVLMGGPGAEREVSLRSGAAVVKALQELSCQVSEVVVDGPEFALPSDVDLAFNIIHGTFGEDGQLQSILDGRGVPYTGDDAESNRICFDKILSKQRFDQAGVATARWEKIGPGELPSLPLPYVVKAPRQGSSVGITIIKHADQLAAGLADARQYGDDVLVEEFFPGKELTVGILGDEVLPVIEIAPHGEFYTYQTKYTKGGSDYYVPARISAEETARVQKMALVAYRSLGLKVYARVDLLMNAQGELSVLEANTIPGMTETSLLPKAAAVVGYSFAALCEKIALLSLRRWHTS